MKEHDFVSKDGTVETTIYYLDCGHRSLSDQCSLCKLRRCNEIVYDDELDAPDTILLLKEALSDE